MKVTSNKYWYLPPQVLQLANCSDNPGQDVGSLTGAGSVHVRTERDWHTTLALYWQPRPSDCQLDQKPKTKNEMKIDTDNM